MTTTRRALPKRQQSQQTLPQLQQQPLPPLEPQQLQLQQPRLQQITTDSAHFPDLYSTYSADVSPLSPTSSTTTISSNANSTTTSTASESSSASWLWPLPSQPDESRNEPSPQRTPQNGPQNVGRPTARRVQRCGVGQSRHAHSDRDRDRPCKSQASLMEVRCWDHGCEGRKFSSLGNYRRHLREKNGQAKVHPCPDCGRVFTRSTARNFHRESGTCGLSPRQLMLQMQMQMQVQVQQAQQAQPLLSSSSSFYPPLNVPSPPFDWDWNSQMDMYSPALLWGNGR